MQTHAETAGINPLHTSNWPRPIVFPEDYDGGPNLQLNWDLGRVDDADKRKAVRQWIARFPALPQLRRLYLWSHVNQSLFDAVCGSGRLECLVIKWSSIRRLDAIRNQEHLRWLALGSSTRLESLQPLTALARLTHLELENLKKIEDFAPLTALRSLESLAVTGSMWTRQKVGSLQPFGEMTWLRALAVDTTHVESLRPLARLRNLESLGIGGRLPMQEYAWLSAKLPHTRCQWFAPWLDLSGSGLGPCRRCGRDTQVMPTGRGSRVICRYCDADRVRAHEQAFARAQQAAREDDAG